MTLKRFPLPLSELRKLISMLMVLSVITIPKACSITVPMAIIIIIMPMIIETRRVSKPFLMLVP